MGDRERVEYERGLRAAVLRGDEAAWRTWYDRCAADLLRYVQWRGGPAASWIDDVVQDTWLTAVKQLRSFDPAAGSFRNWLFGIAANLLRNRFRKAKLPVADVPVSEVPERTANGDDAERTIMALAALNARHERVLRAKYFDERSVTDIAAEWNESPKAIESLLTRAEIRSAPLTSRGAQPMRDLDELLKPPPANVVDDAVFQRTTGVLRRRRWWRRSQLAAALSVCFAAGMATVHWWPKPAIVIEETAPEPTPVEPKSPVDPYRNDPPNSLERWAALAEGEKRLELFRRAGDRHLERGDELGALRCYRKMLDLGGAKALTVSEEDTWLLMSMKLARKREME